MKVVLSGYYGYDNMGDEAILYSIIQALRAQDPAIDITVLSNQPEETAKAYGVSAVNRWRIKDMMKSLKEADGFISGGGSLLQDATSNKTVPYYAGLMQMASWLGKPYAVYAQGIGPLSKKLGQRLTVSSMNKAAVVTVRDEGSLALLRSLGVNRSVDVVPDPVMALEPSDALPNWFHEQGESRPVITLSVRDWPSEEPYLQKMATSVERLAKEKGAAVALLPVHGEHDLKTSQALAEHLQSPYLMFPHDASLEEKLAMVRDSELLIGMRLHALIFAATSNTPFVAVSYDPKIDAIAKQLQQPLVGHVSDPWTADDLYKLSSQLWNDPDIRTVLGEKVKPLKESAERTAIKVLTAFGT
ncbi:polysaccharide pyruvyl transferase CsaB [Litoribacterium kuwaitense]|uniref:polysaccharide pyruvyl transferase CsaB n=1 Tax=Litoribacterium kuwaitense TaxID=1398745 RepID=UPI001FE3B9FE|nr:polysaccharide pyruvyl transferase CsaB [Litoribacterium kuwaitense]